MGDHASRITTVDIAFQCDWCDKEEDYLEVDFVGRYGLAVCPVCRSEQEVER